MTVVLSDNLLRGQLPESSIVIGACGDEIGTISTESAIPDPALMLTQSALKSEWYGWCHRGSSTSAILAFLSFLRSILCCTILTSSLIDLGSRLSIWSWVRNHRLEILDFPDFGGMISTASCKMLDIGGEKNAGDVLIVGLEVCDWDQGGFLTMLDKEPDKDITLQILFSLPLQRNT